MSEMMKVGIADLKTCKAPDGTGALEIKHGGTPGNLRNHTGAPCPQPLNLLHQLLNPRISKLGDIMLSSTGQA